MAEPGFWGNPERAQTMIGELKSIRALIKPLADSIQTTQHVLEMVELADGDLSLEEEVAEEIAKLEETVADLELRALLNGEHDAAGALVSIYARDGGTDANDWAEMLLRMYSQWATKNGYQVELLDRKDDDVAGIQSASVAIRGPMAYGYLKGETGIHRLVRISPFNAEGKRQTSFAAVDVAPEISDEIEIEIDPKDIREDTYCSSGAGGQHVNKTESAVRLTHLPTNTVVACQNERSQHKNRAIAWKLMRAKLARLEEEKREAEDAAKYKNKARTGFGSQIRNYFLHPDQRVKDARTGYGVTQFNPVLDGDIQGFLDAYLRWRVGQDVA
jgi:peptide chain release factor 2